MAGSDAIECRKLILVGKSGNGKSSTGNTILGEQLFKTKRSPSSVTQECEAYSRVNSTVGREFSVVDTPGLFDTDRSFAERALEIQKSLEQCPNPHAFLIIMRADIRFTEEEKLTIDMLRITFGEEFLKHAIVVFTRGSELSSDADLSDFLEENASVDNLKNECEGRVVRIENNPAIDIVTREKMIYGLLDMVEQTSNEGKRSYQYKSLSIHREILKNHLENRKPNAQLQDELALLIEELGRQLKNKESWRPYVVGGLVGVAGMATAGGVYLAAPLVFAGDVVAAGTGGAMMTTALSYVGPVLRGGAALAGSAASTLGKLAVFKR